MLKFDKDMHSGDRRAADGKSAMKQALGLPGAMDLQLQLMLDRWTSF